MNVQNPNGVGVVLGLVMAGAMASPAVAQPWVRFEDSESGSHCGLVNSAEDELVILEDTGELVIVSDVDVILDGTFVDLDNNVFIDGEPFGFIDFFEDADGFATLWWVIEPALRVVDIDQFGGFVESDFLPEDFSNVACDACEFWDDPLDCDEDLDGVADDFDLCLGTPPDADVDQDGCSCFDYDSDDDGIEDCIDLCPDTLPDDKVDEDGCPVGGGGGGGTAIYLCGSVGVPLLGLTLVSMLGLKVVRGGRRRTSPR